MAESIKMNVFISIMGVLLAGCALSSSGSIEQLGATPEDFLRQWASELMNGNVDEMTAFYKDSTDTLAIQSTGQVRKGTAEIRKEYESAFAEVVFEQVTLNDLTVRQNGNAAWAACRFKAQTLQKTQNKKWTLEVYTSFVLERSGKSWKIVLEQSTPIAGVPRVKPRD